MLRLSDPAQEALEDFLEEVKAEDEKRRLLLEERVRKVRDLLVDLVRVPEDADGQQDGTVPAPSWVPPALLDWNEDVASLGLEEMSSWAEQSLLHMIAKVDHGLDDWPRKVLQRAKDDEVRTSALPAPGSQPKTSSLLSACSRKPAQDKLPLI